jgi:hypothetical protein
LKRVLKKCKKIKGELHLVYVVISLSVKPEL